MLPYGTQTHIISSEYLCCKTGGLHALGKRGWDIIHVTYSFKKYISKTSTIIIQG